MVLAPSFDGLSEDFKVLSDKTRLRIIGLLRLKEQCVCDLTEVLQISQPGVSQHMRRLKQVGFVKERKDGQWVYYSLNTEHPLLMLLLPQWPAHPEDEERLLQSKGCRV
ncbi:MAG: metalloregulator ArsR/SmtB family transcription factor [Desulfitobacteriaceae bacterium]|nr:metalloregulator ArsR/SmtB family transcription factor [Desulfitobacteriaceae bacterium]MDI6913164.1 metalloregulator ArsR/SmtB family transcription factor [Desulfitobacteriaceae bacterium]